MSSTAFILLGAAALAVIVVAASLARALRAPSSRDSPDTPANGAPKCKRCGRQIVVDPELSAGALEGMHWLCFHLEYEHDTDPDVPCGDIAGCPWWTIRYYEERLRRLGVDPKEVRQQGLEGELVDHA